MVSQFEVTSDDLHDGVWDTVITNTSYGDNVIALKHSVDAIGGTFNSSNADFKSIVKAIDKPEGNIMAYGYLSGTYTHGNK